MSRALLVLGMHRSGTSAITRVINLLGVPLGSDLLQPQDDNNKGFWEHASAVAINEKLLTALGRNWHDVRELPANWMDHPAAFEARKEIRELVRSELAPNGLWAVKDPRICRLAPLWLSALEQEGVQPKVIVMVRDPREVALSLEKRDGWTLAHSYLMWIQHFLEACEATTCVPRAMATYDGLLSDWRGTMQRIGSELGIEWPVDADQAAAGVDAFITPGDRHHRIVAGGVPALLEATPLPPLLEELNAKAVSVAAGEQGWEVLERLHGTYREAASIYSRPLDELVAERNKLERLALERMDHINGLATAKEIAERRGEEAGAQLEQARSLLQAREMDVAGLHASIEEQRARCSTLEGRVQEQAVRIEELLLDQRELMTLRDALDHERDYITRAFHMSDRMEGELRSQIQVLEARLQREQEVHAAAYARMAEASGHLEARILDRQAELQHLAERAAKQEAEMDVLERQLAEKDAKVLEVSAAYASQAERSALELSDVEQRNRDLDSEREALVRQIELLEGRLGAANVQVSRVGWLMGRLWRNVIGAKSGDEL